MLRVLFLTNIPVPYRMDFFKDLGRHCRLTVCFERRTAGTRDADWLSKRAHSFTSVFMKGIPVGDDSALCPSILGRLDPRAYDAIIIGVYSTPTAIMAIERLRAARVPFFLNCDGGFIDQESRLVSSVKRHLIGSARWGLASGVMAARYLRHYGVDEGAIHTYPFTSVRAAEVLAEPPSEERKRALRRELGIPEGPMAICVGRFLRFKGFDLAVDAWHGMPESFSLLLIGGGPQEVEYRRIMNRHGLRNVRIFGFKQKRELELFFQAADLLLMPSRGEIWGLVVNESLARGLPVIATERCGSACDLLREDQCGLIIAPEDVNALRRMVADVLSGHTPITPLTRAALSVSRRHTIERMVERHLEIFHAAGIE